MSYTYSGPRKAEAAKRFTRPKARCRKEVYMQVRDADLMKELREEAGLSQRQLATLCKCSQAAVSAIETGKLASVSEDLGAHLAKWLNRRPRELFDKFDDTRVAAIIETNEVRTKRRRRGAQLAA